MLAVTLTPQICALNVWSGPRVTISPVRFGRPAHIHLCQTRKLHVRNACKLAES